ncbi:hypothetical protein KM043_012550 [Ampulex compressa]|nr:hypothetical protein KM043_012550 [Ampulex compressa]
MLRGLKFLSLSRWILFLAIVNHLTVSQALDVITGYRKEHILRCKLKLIPRCVNYACMKSHGDIRRCLRSCLLHRDVKNFQENFDFRDPADDILISLKIMKSHEADGKLKNYVNQLSRYQNMILIDLKFVPTSKREQKFRRRQSRAFKFIRSLYGDRSLCLGLIYVTSFSDCDVIRSSEIHNYRKVLRSKRDSEGIKHRKPTMDLNGDIQQHKQNSTVQEYIEFIEIPPHKTYKQPANVLTEPLIKSEINDDNILSDRSNNKMAVTLQTMQESKTKSTDEKILETNIKESAVNINVTDIPIRIQIPIDIESEITNQQEFAQGKRNSDLEVNMFALNMNTSGSNKNIYNYIEFPQTTEKIEFDEKRVKSELTLKNAHPFVSESIKEVVELFNQNKSEDLIHRLENIELILTRMQEKLDGVINCHKSAINISDIRDDTLKEVSSGRMIPSLVSEEKNLIEQLKTILSDTESLSDWHFEMLNPEDVAQFERHFEQSDQTEQPDFPTSSARNNSNHMDYDKKLVENKSDVNSSIDSPTQENVRKPFTLDHLISYIKGILEDTDTWATVNHFKDHGFQTKSLLNSNRKPELEEKNGTQDEIINRQSWIYNKTIVPLNYLQPITSSQEEHFNKNTSSAQGYPAIVAALVQKPRSFSSYSDNSNSNFALEYPRFALRTNFDVSNATDTWTKEKLFSNAQLVARSTQNLTNESLFKKNTNLNNIIWKHPFSSERRFNRHTPFLPALFLPHDTDNSTKSTTTSTALMKNLMSPMLAESTSHDEEFSYITLPGNTKAKILPEMRQDLFDPVNSQNIRMQDKRHPTRFEEDDIHDHPPILAHRSASGGTRN